MWRYRRNWVRVASVNSGDKRSDTIYAGHGEDEAKVNQQKRLIGIIVPGLSVFGSLLLLLQEKLISEIVNSDRVFRLRAENLCCKLAKQRRELLGNLEAIRRRVCAEAHLEW